MPRVRVGESIFILSRPRQLIDRAPVSLSSAIRPRTHIYFPISSHPVHPPMYYLNMPRGYIYSVSSPPEELGVFCRANSRATMRQGEWHVAGLAGDALMSCGNPCLLGGDEISGAKQMRRTIGIREMGVWVCGCGRFERFSPLR